MEKSGPYDGVISNNSKNDIDIPDLKLVRPQLVVIHDNEKKKIFFIQNIFNKYK